MSQPASPSDASAIVTALETIISKMEILSKTVHNFSGSSAFALLTARKIQKQSSDISTVQDAAIVTANASGQLDDEGSRRVFTAVQNLESTLKNLLASLEAKKPAFESGMLALVGVSRQTMESLVKQKGQADELSAILTPKLTAEFQESAPTVQGLIDEHFEHAIGVYSA